MIFSRETTHELIKRASPAKPGKRFLSFCIDYVLVLLVSYLIFLLGYEVIKSNNSYVNAGNIVDQEIEYYNDFVEDTRIVEFVDGERVDNQVTILKNACRAIYHAYQNTSSPDFVIPDSELHGSIINADGTETITVSSYGEASLESDDVAYFYTKYVVENSDKQIVNYYNSTPLEYLYSIYNKYFDGYGIYANNNDGVSIPCLTPEAASKMYIYLFNQEMQVNNNDLWQECKDTFYNFMTGYKGMLDESENLLVRSEPYYSTHYVVYRKYYEMQGQYVNYGLLCSFSISYLLVMLLPKLLLRDGRTLGRLVMSLGVISNTSENIPWYATVIQSTLGVIGFMSTMLLIYLFKPFNGVYDFMMMPLLPSLSWFTMGSLFLIIVIAAITIYISTLFMHYKTSLVDLLTRCNVVDLKHIDEGDYDDQYEGKVN